MNQVTFAFGLFLIAIGLVVLVMKCRDPLIYDTIAAMKKPDGKNAPAITLFVTGVVVPTVTPIAIGIGFLVVGLLGRSLAPLAWFER